MFVAISTYLKPLEELDPWYPAHFEWLMKHYTSGHFLGSGRRVPPNTVQLRRTQDKDSCDQFNDLMKIQIKFQRRSIQMLRFLALIARADPFDDTSLNTHALFGQALLADLFEHTLNHVLPTRCTDHTQRNQILVHDT